MPRLSEIAPDLLEVQSWQRVATISLPFVAVGIYFYCAAQGWWILAVLAVMFFSFVTYGSTSHDLVHRNLGLSTKWNEFFLTAIELLALRSGTAYRLAHLHHHANCLEDHDIEAIVGTRSLAWAVLDGFIFQIRILRWAWREYPAKRVRLGCEVGGCGLLAFAAIAALPMTVVPLTYVVLVVMGSWLIPLITVYIPHDAKEKDALRQTRAFRGWVASVIAMEHLYHLEHHLYPAVPHHHWPTLAKRLDPYLARRGVKLNRFGF